MEIAEVYWERKRKAIEIYKSLGRECDDTMILLNHPCAITTNDFVQDLMNLLSNFNKDYNRINGEDAKLYPEKLIEQFKNYYLD